MLLILSDGLLVQFCNGGMEKKRVVIVDVPRTLGQPGDFKNGWIWLKFCTLGPWVNKYLRGVLSIFDNFHFSGLGTSFFQLK